MVVCPRHSTKAARGVPRHNHCRAKKPANKLKIYLPSFAAESLAAQVWENRAEELSTMGTEVPRSRLEISRGLQGVEIRKLFRSHSAARIFPHIIKGAVSFDLTGK
jgi:hypothetical protein